MSSIRPDRLRCESLENPIGIDEWQPRFSWILVSDERDQQQRAYQIAVSSNGETVWDSGRVDGDVSHHIRYAGVELRPLTAYQWCVRVWNQDDVCSDWAEASFVTGMKPGATWQASWISYPIHAQHPAPHFRSPSFTSSKEVQSAYIAFTAKGVCDVFIDGQRVTEDYLNPGWTDYFKRNHYRVYDVADLLGNGEHHIGAIVAEGWYAGQVGNVPEGIYASRLHFLAELHITYSNGSSEVITTDDQWQCTHGAYLAASIMHGEHVDARLAKSGWCTGVTEGDWKAVAAAPFDAEEWHGKKKENIPLAKNLCAHPAQPVRVIQELPALSVSEGEPGNYIYDFGQNMAGVVRLNLDLFSGACVRLRYAEMVTPDGVLYVENLRSAKATDFYICGSEHDVYQPRFTFHGFRYLEISGISEPLPLEAVTALALGSDTPDAGVFSCSNEMLNQLQSNIRWTQRANFLEVPTDCPQRDERLGWTGDAQVFIATACANAGVEAFFRKWLNDMQDAQRADGTIHNVIPEMPWGGNADAAWGDAITVCPTELYTAYGDPELLPQWYQRMKAFCDYYHLAVDENGIRSGKHCLGDWLALDVEDFNICSGGTSKELIQTAFYCLSHRLTAMAAELAGDAAIADEMSQRAGRSAKAFAAHFFDADGRCSSDTQTAYVLALCFDLLPEEQRPTALRRLVDKIHENDDHLNTGFVGVSYLLPTLSRFGEHELACKLLENKTFPSWGYSIANGATTIWERWNGWVKGVGPGDANMNSYSHYAYGSVGKFMYETVAGLKALEPGYKKAQIAPQPGGSLSQASYSYRSIAGDWQVQWSLTDGAFSCDFSIPANCSAAVSLPLTDIDALQIDGQPLADCPSVSQLRVEDGRVCFDAASGNYLCRVAAVPA